MSKFPPRLIDDARSSEQVRELLSSISPPNDDVGDRMWKSLEVTASALHLVDPQAMNDVPATLGSTAGLSAAGLYVLAMLSLTIHSSTPVSRTGDSTNTSSHATTPSVTARASTVAVLPTFAVRASSTSTLHASNLPLAPDVSLIRPPVVHQVTVPRPTVRNHASSDMIDTVPSSTTGSSDPSGRSNQAGPSAGGLIAELALLTAARGNVESNPHRALELLNNHLVAYPNSTFAQERSVIEIDALIHLARMNDARVRANAFLESHPTSTLAPRVRELRDRAHD